LVGLTPRWSQRRLLLHLGVCSKFTLAVIRAVAQLWDVRLLMLRYIFIVVLGVGGYYAVFWAVHPILYPPQGLYDGNEQHLIQDRYPFHLIAPAWVSDSFHWMFAETLARLAVVVFCIICIICFIRFKRHERPAA
jgi:hypothetical protein